MIEIYHYLGCPYCAKVIRFLESTPLKENQDYVLIEARRGTPGREKVIQEGGKSQVPFMIDQNVKMYESDDIINYIKEYLK